ncbi:DUF2550 domain-containing protein [Rhodococcus chondri]|uniref:DUF2550 domain-containing protein n=1 Tax=Rhodococcus chondri TaxID=3065941 RepID=A0ABU7JUZ5_9NOCA|nr:DUF2550 domain-containing protein [Rhodococcus sp. CC-R104]MEE2033117.1 DUF2550 domain-containing protein [Rhodococcus sp. CC-R104]
MIVLIILVVLLAASVASLLYRATKLRGGGTAAILRAMPNGDGSGWRHGIVRYGDNSLVFYKLSSLRPGPNTRLTRQGIEVVSRRGAEGGEHDIMTEDIVVLEIVDEESRYEIALDRGALTAFLSWVESRPSGRSQRRRTI